MSPSSQRWAARAILAAGVLAGLALLGWRDAPRRISTDVLDLVPPAESASELSLLRDMAGNRQSRVVLVALALGSGTTATDAGARRLRGARQTVVAALRQSGAFAEVLAFGDGSYREALGRLVFDRRFDLLGPGWLADSWRDYLQTAPREPWSAWLAERSAARLEGFLARPEAVGFQDLLHADPLLMVPGLVERWSGLADPSAPASPSETLVWALARGSPLDPAEQDAVAAAFERAGRDLAATAPGVELRWTSVSRLAAESRRRIKDEVARLNILSVVAVLGVALACVRRPLRALLLAPVILFSLLGAWIGAMVVFDRVHVLVFVVGSLLCGVAVDYGFYIFLQPPVHPGETYREKLGRLLRPLLASSLTVVLGFSLLVASDLPLLRQVGVFVSAGLLAALASAILWFAQIADPFLETRRFVRLRPSVRSRSARVVAWSAVGLAGCVVLAGLGRITWRDDIHDLQVAAPGLEANDRDLRERFGDRPSQTVYVTSGATFAQARERVERLADWHARQFPDAPLASLGSILPRPADWAAAPARLAGLSGFAEDFRAALARHGFDPGAFDSFFDAWTRWRSRRADPAYESFVRDFGAALPGPASLAMAEAPGACWFMAFADHAPGAEPPLDTHTYSAHQLESLNRLFARYRISALRLSAVGLGLVGLSVLAIYGWRRGLGIFAVPCGSCLFAFGLFGLVGHPLNLLNLLGAFLGVCLAHNYAIFTWENACRGQTPPPSIRLSALCTAASFGVLALSGIPVVSALGSTVAIIVLAALVAVELGPLLGGRPRLAADGPVS